MTQDEIKKAIIAQEEHIKRQLSCNGVVGKAHAFRSYGAVNHPTFVWSQCIMCEVTETSNDYEIKMKTH